MPELPIEKYKEMFLSAYRENINRDGADALLDYLENKSDFFSAPASTQFHGAFAGGLCFHSVNVFTRLLGLYTSEYVDDLRPLTDKQKESIAICGLLHDICKIGCYKAGTRNVKGEDGKWIQVPTYSFADPLPYGHGEKSVYIISGFMRLSRDEAMAIRWHMGFSGPEDTRTIGQALEHYPLALLTHIADLMATDLDESTVKEEKGA